MLLLTSLYSSSSLFPAQWVALYELKHTFLNSLDTVSPCFSPYLFPGLPGLSDGADSYVRSSLTTSYLLHTTGYETVSLLRLSDMRWCPVLKISIKQSWSFISNIRNVKLKAAGEDLQVSFKNVFPTNTTPMLSSSAENLFLQNHLYAPTSNLIESTWKTYQTCWLLCLHWHHLWAILTHVSYVTALETPYLLKLNCFLQNFSMFFVKIIGPLRL